jgi:hypothetical protein
MATRKAGPISSFFFGILFTLIGGGLTYFKAYPDYKAAKESSLWPQAEGVILRSEVNQRRGKKNKTQYSSDISYSYEIDGKRYQSSQVYIGSEGTSSSSSKDAYKYKNKYPVGKQVTVFYSKNEESNAILEPGVKKNHYIFLGIGLFFAVVGLLAFVSSLFKIAIFATMAGVFLASLFGKKQNTNNGSPPPSGTSRRKSSSRKSINNKRSTLESNNDLDIDLDDEMSHFNKVSSSNCEPDEVPWNHKWFIKGTDKDYGPYSFEKVLDYYRRGKVKGNHKCYSSSGGNIVKISNIIDKKKAG